MGGSGLDTNSSLLMAGNAWRARGFCLWELPGTGENSPGSGSQVSAAGVGGEVEVEVKLPLLVEGH